jgi:hypothetical protein
MQVEDRHAIICVQICAPHIPSTTIRSLGAGNVVIDLLLQELVFTDPISSVQVQVSSAILVPEALSSLISDLSGPTGWSNAPVNLTLRHTSSISQLNSTNSR